MGQILGQYCIYVADLERAIGFWEGICGIPVRSRTEIPNVLEAVLMAEQGGSRLQLAQRTDRSGPVDMGSAMWKAVCQHRQLPANLRQGDRRRMRIGHAPDAP